LMSLISIPSKIWEGHTPLHGVTDQAGGLRGGGPRSGGQIVLTENPGGAAFFRSEIDSSNCPGASGRSALSSLETA